MLPPDTTTQLINEILDRLEDASEAGQPLSVESACGDHLELVEIVSARWQKLNAFDEKFNSSGDTVEYSEELRRTMDTIDGCRLVSHSEIEVHSFHDRGGLSEVYRATETELSREIAVKVLRTDRNLESNRLDFKRESEIVGRMNHPGIVSLLACGETPEGRPFYTMPFLAQGSLKKQAEKFHNQHPQELPADEKEFRDLLYRLINACKTVAYAHSRGIVHRDLKAENIMLGNYGETLVIDWGCARKFTRDERFRSSGEQTLQLTEELFANSSSSALTLRYASPEQLQGSTTIGPESDIYSLGAVLYKLLTGECPYQREPDKLVCKLVLAGQLLPASSIKPGVPEALSAICQKAMATQPQSRYATALAMADDLERYLADMSVSVCQDSFGVNLLRRVRRNQKASVGIFLALVAASVLLMISFAVQNLHLKKIAEIAKQHRKMAATLAADAGGTEIDRRWRLLELEAMNPELIEAMQKIQADPQDRSLWKVVQGIIDLKSNQYERVDEVHHESLFVIAENGIQIARSPFSAESVGGDYAYRDYFHGQGRDLRPGEKVAPANHPVVSVVYISTNSGEIKTSFSVPIKMQSETGERVLGRLCMSVPLEELRIFSRLESEPVNAVLIETREYEWGSGKATGLVIDSPTALRSALTPLKSMDPQARADQMPRMNADSISKLLNDWQAAMTSSSSGNTRQSALFTQGLSIPELMQTGGEAAFMPIRVPHRAPNCTDTGWMVVLFEKLTDESE